MRTISGIDGSLFVCFDPYTTSFSRLDFRCRDSCIRLVCQDKKPNLTCLHPQRPAELILNTALHCQLPDLAFNTLALASIITVATFFCSSLYDYNTISIAMEFVPTQLVGS